MNREPVILSSNVLDCCCESSRNALADFNSFLEESKPKLSDINSEVYLNGQIYQTDVLLEEVDVIIKLVRRNWCYLQGVILNNSAIPHNELISIREEINKCLRLVLESLNSCENASLKSRYLSAVKKHIKMFSPLVLPIAEMEDAVFFKLASSARNKEICPVYQYFHTLLDIKYYLLLLDCVSRNNEDLRSRIHEIIKDFIVLSNKCFVHNKKSAFVCDCNKNVWLLIQCLCEKNLEEDSFWPMFNKAVDGQDDRFILWLLRDIAELQAMSPNGSYIGCLSERIKPNYPILENSLKSIITDNPTTSMLPILKVLEPVACNLWQKSAKIEMFQVLWDYFGKRMNILSKKNLHYTMPELVELIDTILWTPKDCDQEFELFLSMLCTHLNEHPYHWGKMKGRIFSQLGPNKIKDLNNTGLFYVLLMFICLTKVSFDELSKKFLTFVENLPAEKKKSELLWSFYTAFIVRHVRENRSIETISASFNKMLEEASSDHHLFFLLKNFVTDLEQIVKHSSNLQLHQRLLINSWLHKYMTSCYHQDLIILLNILVSILDRVNNDQVWCDWESTFKDHVYSSLKYVATSRSAPDVCGTLAAKIALSSSNLLSEAFTFFNNETIAVKVSSNFLCVVLNNYPYEFVLTPQQEVAAVQSWVKTCLLTRDNYEELTRNIAKLDIVPPCIKQEIIKARDPLCSFIETVADSIQQHLQTSDLLKFCEHCFGQTERWITPYLAQADNEATVLRIFTCIGLAFYKIGSLLYNKHKANSSFTRLVYAILLPNELMTGKTPNPHVLQAIKKTWHLFFEAAIKLNTSNDPFIERTLRELIVKYVPHFSVVDSPMLKCLDNESVAEVMLDKMSNAFFKHPTKEADSNIFKALRIINDFVQSTTSEALLKLVVNKTLNGLFEIVMFHNQQNLALSIIKNITTSALFPRVMSEFEEVIVAVTEKHLAFSTAKYFQLMSTLGKFIPSNVKNVMSRVKQQIVNVERMRGVGFDKNLRLNLERLEAIVR